MKLAVKVKKLSEDAVIPEFKTKGAAGFDLVATEDALLMPPRVWLDLEKGLQFDYQPMKVGTGLAFELPEGYEMEIRGRSSMAFKYDIYSFNGTIDADYRGEVGLLLYNMGAKPFYIKKGDRVAQGIIKQIDHAVFVESEELSDTVRGTGGFGSTGK